MPCSDYGTGRLAGLNVQVRYADGRPLGCRRADAVSSHVIVDAMPVAEFSQAAARAGFRDATVVYTLLGEKVAYVGRGSANRLVFQVNQMGATFAHQVFVVHTRDPRAGERAAKHLEGGLIEAALAAGSRLTNKVAGSTCSSADDIDIDLERMLAEALLFLAAAGCPIFEAAAARPNNVEDSFDFLDDGYRIIAADEFSPPEGAVLLRLRHPSLVCEGFEVDGRLTVRPGSDFAIKPIVGDRVGGLKQCNVRRYRAIRARAVGEAQVGSRPARAKLNAWVAFERPDLAARILACSHSTPLDWVPVAPDEVGSPS